MADDKTKREPADHSRVNIHEDHERQYWAERFGITPQQLIEAVAAVGPKVDDVARKLSKLA